LSRSARAARAGARPHYDPAHLRPPRRERRRAGADRGLHRRHDGPIRAHVRQRAELVARIKDTSVEEVKAVADIVAVVSARTQLDARRRRRARLLALLDAASTFYERYLWDSQAGSLARDYLAGRGLGEDVCREYRLGLALGGTTLARKALERGFTREELAAAGLVNRRGNDYFSGRLLFPLADARGRVLGFQARKLREDDPLRAKYVNSPEGELFRKGDLLYGLDRARPAIAKQERAVVVEGNTDVLALHQAGVEPVVASMGTALTERQLKELSRLSTRVGLRLDG